MSIEVDAAPFRTKPRSSAPSVSRLSSTTPT